MILRRRNVSPQAPRYLLIVSALLFCLAWYLGFRNFGAIVFSYALLFLVMAGGAKLRLRQQAEELRRAAARQAQEDADARERGRRAAEEGASYRSYSAPPPPPREERVPRDDAELKRLFRELAKRYHPDHAASPEDRQIREDLMKKINRAYAEGNVAALRFLGR